MKYKHEFAVKHLPHAAIGTFMVSVGVILWLVVLYHILVGVGGFSDFIMATMGAAGMLFGGMILSDGVEYTSTLKPEPVDPPERRVITQEEIIQRREEILAMDFGPHDNDVKLAKRAKKEALKKELLT